MKFGTTSLSASCQWSALRKFFLKRVISMQFALGSNNSFKPSPLRGLGAKPVLLGRAGLTQALGRSQQVFRPRAFKSRSKPISCCWQRQQGHLPNDSFARHGHSSGVAQTRYPSTVVGVDRKQHRPALHSGQRSLSAVKSIAGQRPNNSFKPNPLRGSA